MPIKLILFLIIIVVVTVFAGFNISNVCNVSLIFYEFQNVPVFVTVLFSFVIGILVMLPFTFRKKTPKQNNSVAVGNQQNPVSTKTQSDDEKTVFKIKAGSGKNKTKVDSKKTENAETEKK